MFVAVAGSRLLEQLRKIMPSKLPDMIAVRSFIVHQ